MQSAQAMSYQPSRGEGFSVLSPQNLNHQQIVRERASENTRIAKRSEAFLDDNSVAIEKRCYFLLCGEDDVSDFMDFTTSVNIFKLPREPYRITVNIALHNVFVEVCNEIIKSQTQLIPQFSPFFRYEDLYPCRPKLTRIIENISVLYPVKRDCIPSSFRLRHPSYHVS